MRTQRQAAPGRRLLAALGLVALLTMHALTTPTGHAHQQTPAPTSDVVHQVTATSADPDGMGGDHLPPGTQAAVTCAVVILAACSALTLELRSRRVIASRPIALTSLSWRPDPPVPRLALAR